MSSSISFINCVSFELINDGLIVSGKEYIKTLLDDFLFSASKFVQQSQTVASNVMLQSGVRFVHCRLLSGISSKVQSVCYQKDMIVIVIISRKLIQGVRFTELKAVFIYVFPVLMT